MKQGAHSWSQKSVLARSVVATQSFGLCPQCCHHESKLAVIELGSGCGDIPRKKLMVH